MVITITGTSGDRPESHTLHVSDSIVTSLAGVHPVEWARDALQAILDQRQDAAVAMGVEGAVVDVKLREIEQALDSGDAGVRSRLEAALARGQADPVVRPR